MGEVFYLKGKDGKFQGSKGGPGSDAPQVRPPQLKGERDWQEDEWDPEFLAKLAAELPHKLAKKQTENNNTEKNISSSSPAPNENLTVEETSDTAQFQPVDVGTVEPGETPSNPGDPYNYSAYSPYGWLNSHPDLEVVENARVGDYQGDYLYLVKHVPTGTYAFLVEGYGSCGGCDVWQAAQDESARWEYEHNWEDDSEDGSEDNSVWGERSTATPAGENPGLVEARRLAGNVFARLKFYQPNILADKLEAIYVQKSSMAEETPEWYFYDDDVAGIAGGTFVETLRTFQN